jgi:hypothetical protein
VASTAVAKPSKSNPFLQVAAMFIKIMDADAQGFSILDYW